jgi:hypothetical protein
MRKKEKSKVDDQSGIQSETQYFQRPSLKLDVFTGRDENIDADLWFLQFENYLQITGLNKECLSQGLQFFSDAALRWFVGKAFPTTTTLKEFKQAFLEQFGRTVDKILVARQKFGAVNQGSRSIADFSREFEELLYKAYPGDKIHEALKVQMFCNGLREEIADEVLKNRDDSYERAKQSALIIESLINRKKLNASSTASSTPQLSTTAAPRVISSMNVMKDKDVDSTRDNEHDIFINATSKALDTANKAFDTASMLSTIVQKSLDKPQTSATATTSNQFNRPSTQYAHLDEDEYNRRREARLCYKCGRSGHQARNCGVKRPFYSSFSQSFRPPKQPRYDPRVVSSLSTPSLLQPSFITQNPMFTPLMSPSIPSFPIYSTSSGLSLPSTGLQAVPLSNVPQTSMHPFRIVPQFTTMPG